MLRWKSQLWVFKEQGYYIVHLEFAIAYLLSYMLLDLWASVLLVFGVTIQVLQPPISDVVLFDTEILVQFSYWTHPPIWGLNAQQLVVELNIKLIVGLFSRPSLGSPTVMALFNIDHPGLNQRPFHSIGREAEVIMFTIGVFIQSGLLLMDYIATSITSTNVSSAQRHCEITGATFQLISFSAKEIDVVEWKGDILAVGVTEKDMVKDENLKFQNPILKKLDSHSSGLLAEASLEEDFNGKGGQSTVLRLSGIG
ncbi:hypothetical protein RHMOL_Rhmol01G0208600 [Rhododendron molle]|uniref:Uncharacterized protein n=1 Tax=Rhododendron molle TaxID=49168 RepID=A0ACC0Q5R6_RHOML|nr:hypothetical protein RHMOL_Rhmol01G0208600 [Rhododendron molle]